MFWVSTVVGLFVCFGASFNKHTNSLIQLFIKTVKQSCYLQVCTSDKELFEKEENWGMGWEIPI